MIRKLIPIVLFPVMVTAPIVVLGLWLDSIPLVIGLGIPALVFVWWVNGRW